MRPNGIRRAVAAALLLITGLSASACDGPREGAVNVVVIGDPLSLADPADGAISPSESLLLSNVAQGLVRFDARGQIVGGLAERWNVTDDGLSYIFRLATDEWPNGERITAHQVARILRRQLAARSNNPIKDTLGAVEEIVAMTDRVLEIRLSAPRPHLLQVLAQPEMAVLREGLGTGPFSIVESEDEPAGDVLRLEREVPVPDEEEEREEEIVLQAADAPTAIRQFLTGDADLVLGGSFVDLPLVRASGAARDALRFDPAAGLFGLVPAREDGPIADVAFRRLLSQAVDRPALLNAFNVPGLLPRATMLEPGLASMPAPVEPEWALIPSEQRRAQLIAAADRLFEGAEQRPILSVSLPVGPGADILLNRLATDWAVLGIGVRRASPGDAADLKLVDTVAPSNSAAWFLRQFRCEETPICLEEADSLLEAARAVPVEAQRAALLNDAARLMDEAQLFIPLTAPIRWALVSDHVPGFALNRFARHPLTGLTERLTPERAE